MYDRLLMSAGRKKESMESKNWFDVDKNGLAELQAGKPKVHIIRELIANAWDEQITECRVQLTYSNGRALISVEDDCPEGFADLADAFTLFKHTKKREDTSKRGRFNLGEKTSISLCNQATIETTKGKIVFDRNGRTVSKSQRMKGSKITLKLKLSKEEFDQLSEIKNYLIPKGIRFFINNEEINYREPHKILEAKLLTEKLEDNILKRISRSTKIHLYLTTDKAFLFELGIPVQEIECDFSVSVEQKIPLGTDRETVLPSFLKELYAIILNNTFQEVECPSDLWVRTAITSKNIESNAVKEMMTRRYGEKACIANPFDKRSMDEAISHGYNIIYGSEMSKEEWGAVKKDNLMPTSSNLFGVSFVGAELISELTPDMQAGEVLCKKIAKRLLGIELKVRFIKSKATEGADFDFGANLLTFNISRLGAAFFNPPVSAKVLDLILHEISHFQGRQHTEMRYHTLLTKIGGELIMLALTEPSFFEVGL